MLLHGPWLPQTQFAPPERWSFDERNGFGVDELSGPAATARVSRKGGQVLSWAPKGFTDVLWVSPLATLSGNLPIRGGIPVCWPWFGPHASDPDAPQHGLVRTEIWEPLESLETEEAGTLRLRAPEPVLGGLAVALEVRAGETLSLTLVTTNLGNESAAITEALHTYFRISGLKTIRLAGLDGCDYADNNDPRAAGQPYGPIKRQSGAVSFDDQEMTRLYRHEGSCTLIDAGLGRLVRMTKAGSRTTVVWNPGAARARTMPDLPPGANEMFVCIESGTAGPDRIVLAPGESHALEVTYSVETL
jgi:D-hexose-6-phosphate mutarotase